MKLAALLSLLILFSFRRARAPSMKATETARKFWSSSLYLNQISAAILHNEPRRFRGRYERNVVSRLEILSGIAFGPSVEGSCASLRWTGSVSSGSPTKPGTPAKSQRPAGSIPVKPSWKDCAFRTQRPLQTYFERRVWPDTRPT